jgi:hypothetical protein
MESLLLPTAVVVYPDMPPTFESYLISQIRVWVLSYKKGVVNAISYQPPAVALPLITIDADDKAVVNPVKKVVLGNAVSEF